MRRLACSPRAATAIAATTTTALTAATRDIYSIWTSVPQEKPLLKTPWKDRITAFRSTRSFNFWHSPVKTIDGTKLNAVETYLNSAIEDDLKRLMAVDWTYEFDSFWRDRVNSHAALYKIVYTPGFSFFKHIFGNSNNEAARLEIGRKLNQLQATLKWAEETERRYTSIANARFHMQREVFDAFEREKILAGCVELCEEFKNEVPSDFKRKAVGELENHLMNMRHWIWDCPNAKQTFARRLA